MERRDSNMTSWLWQILAIVGSILSTVAIGGLLAHYDSKPVFDWVGVTLNAIVAVFSAVAKALLAFALAECLGQAKWIWTSQTKRPLNDINILDEASRGPLGSLKLFEQLVARSFISIGAIAVILSAVIDPFVQLTIGKKDALTYEEDPLTQIAYAKRYSKGAFSTVLATTLPSTDGNTYRSTNVDADFSMKSAVFYGMSEPESAISQHMKYSCYSGNCTWEEYESLAICSACNDLTKSLASEKKSGSPLSIYLSITNPGTMIGTYTKYRLPNGLEGDNSVAMTAFGTGNESDTVTFKDRDTLIWAMTIMNFTITGPSSETKVTAAECGLWYCVNKYTSSFEKGNLTEIVTPAQAKRNPQSWQRIQEKSTDNITVEPSNSIMYGISASVPRTDLQIGNGFNLSKAALYGISDFMNKTFSTRERTGRINAYAYNNVTFQPTVVQQLYNAPNLSTIFQSLAMSMTNNIRQNSDNNTVKVGQAGTCQILIRTRPWFLALPALLNLAGLVFLALVMHYSHQSRLAPWGTNALPIVALGAKVGRVFNYDKMSTRRLEETAKRELVQFPVSPTYDAVSTAYQGQEYEMVAQTQPRKNQPTASVISALTTDDRDFIDHGRRSVRSLSPDLYR